MINISDDEVRRYELLDKKMEVYRQGKGPALTPNEVDDYANLRGKYVEHTLRMAKFRVAEALRKSPEGITLEKMLKEQGRQGVVFHPCPHCHPPIR